MAVTLWLTVKAFAVHVKYAWSSGTRRRQTTRPLSRDLKLDPWLATVMELWPLHGSPPLALPISTMGLQQCDSVTLCTTCSPLLPHGAALWHRVSLALLCHTLPTRCHTHVHPPRHHTVTQLQVGESLKMLHMHEVCWWIHDAVMLCSKFDGYQKRKCARGTAVGSVEVRKCARPLWQLPDWKRDPTGRQVCLTRQIKRGILRYLSVSWSVKSWQGPTFPTFLPLSNYNSQAFHCNSKLCIRTSLGCVGVGALGMLALPSPLSQALGTCLIWS